MRREWIAVLLVAVTVGIGAVFVARAATGAGTKPATEQRLLTMKDNRYVLDGWKHQGPGGFNLDATAGVLKSYGGMGLLYYAAKQYGDFTLELDFRCADKTTNSGVFLRVPGEPASDDYIYHSFEIQIDDASEGIHHTGAVYDAEAPNADALKRLEQAAKKPDETAVKPGEWRHFAITFRGSHITVVLDDVELVSWDAAPRGKVKDFAPRGYVGLQNHDDKSPVEFRNIVIRELP
jgi:hypothetical protein